MPGGVSLTTAIKGEVMFLEPGPFCFTRHYSAGLIFTSTSRLRSVVPLYVPVMGGTSA